MDWLELYTDHTFRMVCIGAMLIGAVSGAIGCFAYLRRQSLVGDVVAHSSLLGIMLFFLASYAITGQGNKSLAILIPGAMTSGFAALFLTRFLVRQTHVRDDSGLAVMLAIFFGTGIVLLRWVQGAQPVIPGRSGLEDFIFGMAAAMTWQDLLMIVGVGTLSTILLMLNWKQLKVFTFDPLFAHSLGYSTKRMDALLVFIIVCGIVIGLQTIGVVLMIALLVTPAAAARQWTRTLGAMVVLASILGATSAGIGAAISAQFSGIPTGPAIVLVGAVLFIFSLLLAPRRGVLMSRQGRSQIESLIAKRGNP